MFSLNSQEGQESRERTKMSEDVQLSPLTFSWYHSQARFELSNTTALLELELWGQF